MATYTGTPTIPGATAKPAPTPVPTTVGPTPYPPGGATSTVPETTGPTIIGTPTTGAPGATGTVPSTTATGTGSDTSSARDLVLGFMTMAGLSSLGDWAWEKYLKGDSFDQIMMEARATPEYQARFPAMAELSRRGEAMTEAAYISYEVQIKQLTQQYGIPQGMYDTPDAIKNMLLNNVSIPEATTRMNAAAVAAYSVPDSVRSAFAQRVGVANTNGGLIAAYLDDTKALPLLEQQFAQSQVAGAAADAKLAQTVSSLDVNDLAARGISYTQALQGFQQVAGTAGLGSALGGETVGQQQRINAQFGDAMAQATQTRVQRGRLVQAAQGGNLVEAQTGVTGLAPSTTR